MHNNVVKIIFGCLIFLFSLALAYFIASYVDKIHAFDYYFTLAFIAIGYILCGLAVSQIYALSLGFLFASDVLILHVLASKYTQFETIYKTGLVAIMLIILYSFAWFKGEHATSVSPVAPTPPPPPLR